MDDVFLYEFTRPVFLYNLHIFYMPTEGGTNAYVFLYLTLSKPTEDDGGFRGSYTYSAK